MRNQFASAIGIAILLAALLPGCTKPLSGCDWTGSCTGGGGAGGARAGGSGGASGGAAGHASGGAGKTGDGGGGAGGAAPCGGACVAPKPACDTATNTCVECTANTDCPSATPFCDMSAHSCVQCLASSDCTDAATARCDAGACKPCTADADCSHMTGQTVCDTASGACVQCTGTDYAACGTDSATSTPLVCDSLQHTCTTNKEHSSGLCGGCVSDAQCPLGQMCVLETFGSPAQDVGYFCFWKQADTSNGAPADCPTQGRPYSKTITSASSIDGATADICTLTVSTCVANNQFRSKTCTSTSDNTTCGFNPPNDAKCAAYGASFRCTMTCGSDDDCPLGFSCNTLVNPRVCNLQ